MKKTLMNLVLDSGAESFSAGYQAILDRASTLGYTAPSEAQQSKQNTLYESFPMSELDFMYVAHNDIASNFWRLNWVAPSSYEMTEPAGALTKVSNSGVHSDGTTTYGNSPFVLSVDNVKYLLNDCSVFFSVVNNVAANKYACGTVSSGETRFAPRWSDNNFYGTINSASGSYNTYANASSIGFYHYIRTNATTIKLYKDGVQVDTETKSSTSLPTNPFVLCSATPSSPSTYRIGVLGIGSNLEASASSMYSAWNTYIS